MAFWIILGLMATGAVVLVSLQVAIWRERQHDKIVNARFEGFVAGYYAGVRANQSEQLTPDE